MSRAQPDTRIPAVDYTRASGSSSLDQADKPALIIAIPERNDITPSGPVGFTETTPNARTMPDSITVSIAAIVAPKLGPFGSAVG